MRARGRLGGALVGLAGLALLLGGVGQVKAGLITSGWSPGSGGTLSPGEDPLYRFNYSDSSGNVASAILTADSLGGGRYLVTSGTLDVTGGAAKGTYPLVPGGPAVFFSLSGAFFVDNVLYPSQNPILDGAGLLFKNGSTEVNI
jgi:hypothetical protein